MSENNELEIGGVIELFDEAGDSVKFDHLDTIEMNGKKYVVLTPYVSDEELEDDEGESDVYIMAVVESETGENVLEMVDSEEEIEQVFQEFKKRTEADYEFLD